MMTCDDVDILPIHTPYYQQQQHMLFWNKELKLCMLNKKKITLNRDNAI